MKHLFVTVGTTKFPKLVDTLTQLSTIQALADLGYTSVQIQTGRDFHEVCIDPNVEATVTKNGTSWIVKLTDFNILVKYEQYFEDFESQIKKADLVISHAGAGSCLDILRLGKPLIVVVNEDLMDNHQMELAEQLQKDGHLYFCVCSDLSKTLCKDFSHLVPYPKAEKKLFANYLDKCCGFLS